MQGTRHSKLELSYRQQEIELSDLVWSLKQPIADLSSLGFLAISNFAAQHVTVALSGQGADELLGGFTEAPRGGASRALAAPAPPAPSRRRAGNARRPRGSSAGQQPH